MSTTTSILKSKSPPTLKRVIANHPVAAYFVLAFVFSWIAVLPLLLARSGLVHLPTDLPVEPFQIAGALLGPTLAAFILTAVLSGRVGMRQLLARYVQWRVGLRWYLLVVIGPPVALNLGAIPFLGMSIVGAFVSNLPQLVSFYLPVLVVGVILGPLWEEPGWRGFALPRLQRRYGALAGTLVLGLLWSFWHVPGFFGGWLGGPSLLSSFLALMLGTTAFAIIMTWIYNHTRGSLLVMILLHSAFNAASAMGGKILPPGLPARSAALIANGWIPAATSIVLALVVIGVTKGSLSNVEPGHLD